jgi:hypothetical protein
MKSPDWRIIFLACTLIYMAVVTWLSLGNFGMVHREYRQAARQLRPERVEQAAIRELAAECRRGSGARLSPGEAGRGLLTADDPCLSPPAGDVEKRSQAVRERLEEKKSGIFAKLVLFYITFVVFFLLLPPLIIYLVLTVFIWIFRSVQ